MTARDASIESPPFVKPIRVPDDVECQLAEPSLAHAGEKGDWRFSFVTCLSVQEEVSLHVLFFGGRNVKGTFRIGEIEGRGPDGSRLELLGKAGGDAAFAVPEGGIERGGRVTVTLRGATAPELSLPSKMVLLYVALPEEETEIPATNYEPTKRIIGACLVNVIGGALDHLRVHAPSFAVPGETVSVLVRGEDTYNNLACERPGELQVWVEGELVSFRRADHEHWACCELTAIALHGSAGPTRIVVTDGQGRKAESNPIHSVPADRSSSRAYWGMIHGHTELSDGAGTIDHYFSYMRDACRLDFGAPGDHDHLWETSDGMWRMTQDAVARYNEPGRFVALLGYEWAKWRRNGDGDRNVYYADDHRPLHRSDEGHAPAPSDLYQALRDERAIVIPHHSANRGNHCDWKDHDPTKDRLVEIFSEWGSSECGRAEGNPFPMRPWRDEPERLDSGEVSAGFVQRALKMGWRVGFTAGGDDHRGHPGDMTPRTGDPAKSAGLMCVLAPELTREAIWQAMYDRRCYGTTGARILVEFLINGEPMGSELFLDAGPGLRDSRTIKARVHGTNVVKTIEIIRNNRVLHVHIGRGMDEACEFKDRDRFDDVALPPNDHWATPFIFYYLRVTQTDGEMAWASPVWVSER